MRIIDSFLKIASCLVCLLLEVRNVDAQLVINVKNLGGDVLQETIWSNVTEDTVTLEFQRSDGTLVTQLVDFANDVQIMRVLMLGEEERGQSQYQVMCFLLYADKADFISPDAMGKLRQKNPGTVRSAEENRGTTETPLQLWVDLALVGVVSPHAPAFCAEARGAIYARRDDVIKWAERPGISVSQLMSAVTPFPDSATICADEKSQRSPCTCRLEVCVGWFPCGLKYCKGRPQAGAVASQQNNYRCGIKTCRRCNGFSYHVRRKASCLFDD